MKILQRDSNITDIWAKKSDNIIYWNTLTIFQGLPSNYKYWVKLTETNMMQKNIH